MIGWATRSRASAALAAAAGLALWAGCREEASWAPEEDRSSVEVREASLAIETGEVGQGRFAEEATYVLVDARNTGERDLAITLAGTLTSASGAPIGELDPESLRVPAGGQRTFALVDAEQAVRPEAAGASIRVAGAAVRDYAPPLVITDGHIYDDRDHLGRERVVVAGRVENREEGRARVLVMAAFYGQGDTPIERPFAVLAVGGGQQRAVRFVGPPGSRRGYLFVGPASF